LVPVTAPFRRKYKNGQQRTAAGRNLSFRFPLILNHPGGADLDAGAHGRGGDAALHILALGGGGLGLDDGAHEGVEVVVQLLRAEGHLADGTVDDVGLVQAVLDLTGLDLLHSLGHVGGDGAGLGGGHQALGAQQLTQTAHGAHHVGAGHDHVELKPVLLLDLLHHVPHLQLLYNSYNIPPYNKL